MPGKGGFASDFPGRRVGAHGSAPSKAGCSLLAFKPPGYINPLFSLKAAKLIRERGIEVVHLHRSQDLALFAPINIPKVLTLQIQSSLPKRDLWHCWIYSRTRRILTISRLMREQALKSLPVKDEKVHVLHYGIAADEVYAERGDRSQTRQQFGIPEDAFLIGLIGRLEASKGQDVLLRAFASIAPKYPQARLLLAGEPPPEGKGHDGHLKDLALKLAISDRVHFIGFQAETPPIFAALDLFVLASKQEAFGLVLLEAMAQGVPIIATRAGGVPEAIENGVNGILVSPGDPSELAGAIERLMRDAEERRRLGHAGFQIVRGRFGMEAHLSALERHFEEVIQQQSRPVRAKSAKQ
jgi:glycosyltransferase involved in cell wall biosynthesis